MNKIDKWLILAVIVILAAIIVLCLNVGKALAKDYEVVKEPIVLVDRYDVRKLQNDPSVLVSAEERTKPMIESALSDRYKEQVKVIYVQAEQKKVEDEAVKITATIGSDGEDFVPYNL